MKNLETTGGARIGMANATWPFATLKVSKDKLELNASIVGNLVFQSAAFRQWQNFLAHLNSIGLET